jgi:hypothetical protein
MAEDTERGAGDNAGKRRRRRRRRRGRGPEDGVQTQGPPQPSSDWGDQLLVESEDEERPQRRGGRRQVEVPTGTVVNVPSSGKNPPRRRTTRARRTAPGSAAGRRRRLSPAEVGELTEWLSKVSEPLVANLYRGLGGQPGRVESRDRMIQLAVRAIVQGTRLQALVRGLQERDRKALAALLQAGSIAHAEELHRELSVSLGGHEREWSRVMHSLAERGVVMATPEQDGQFFYVIPDVLVDGLLAEIGDELKIQPFTSAEVRVMDERPFCPPLDFSVTTLATYIDQHRPRLTQRHEIHRHDQEQMDAFFAQLWEPESELFAFHIDFLMMHGMVELRSDALALNRDVMEEWLQLEPEDQRDLVFRALNKRFALAEWVLWAVAEAKGAWIAERPLMAMYRRWKRGEDWRDRYARNSYAPSRTSERESFSFSQLVRIGLLDMGQWGQEKFYRLSPRGKQLLEPPEDEGFRQFYLTPSFEIMAPAGLAPVLLFRIGELAALTGCDRANTYKIEQERVEKALDRGWRRDDILQFLRDNSQIGVPDNVEATLKGWIGHRGDVEFHELTLMTVHRSQIRRLEGNRRVKPYLLHRFAPGMYAVDKNRLSDIEGILREAGFDPSKDRRRYPGDPDQVEARQNLHRLVAEARESAIDPTARGADRVLPEKLQPVPGTKVAAAAAAEEALEEPTFASTPQEIRLVLDRAMSEAKDVEMTYLAKNGQKMNCKVTPERLAFKSDQPVLVGMDREEKERRTFLIERIERARII